MGARYSSAVQVVEDLLKQCKMFLPPADFPVFLLELAGCVTGTAEYNACFCLSCSHSAQAINEDEFEAYVLYCEGGFLTHRPPFFCHCNHCSPWD